jgi:spore coat polysaccharide biosynthesis protein SpsF
VTTRRTARVAAVVQGRMSSSRLPGKVMTELTDGRRTLDLVIERLRRAQQPAMIAVATSKDPSDDPIAERAERLGVTVVRGPLDDVLERYRLTTVHLGCDAVVRITADCPLVMPELVDVLVDRWRAGTADYVANILEPRSFPKGLDIEILSREALLAAANEAQDPYDREHVTPFVRSRADRFPSEGMWLSPAHPDIRLTLDTPEDLAELRGLFRRLSVSVGLAEVLRDVGITAWRLADRPQASEASPA